MLRKFKHGFLLILILLIKYSEGQQQNSTNTSNTTQQYQIFASNYLYQVSQKVSAQTYQIQLLNSYFNQKYIVIDIIILSRLNEQSKFIACLNYDQDPLKLDSFIQQGAYNCTFQDQVAQQQNLPQQLIVIDINETSYQINSTVYLTVFYQSLSANQTNTIKPIPQVINYDVYIYYYNKIPCHSSCNGLNGQCDDKTGKCACNQYYTGADCNLYMNPLNLQNDKDNTYITIQPQSQYTFAINMTNFIQKANGKSISLYLKKLYGASNLNIYMLFNINQQPSANVNQMSIVMPNIQMNITDIDQLCQKFPKNQQSLSNNNNTKPNSNQCFIVVTLQQQQLSKLSMILNVAINIQANSTNSSNSTQIIRNSTDNQQNNNTSSNEAENNNDNTSIKVTQQYQAYEIVIYVFIVLAFILVATLIFCSICRRCQKIVNQRQAQQQINQIDSNFQNQLQPAPNTDLLNSLQQKIKIQQKKKLIISKKRALQNYLMPSVPFQPQKRTQLDISIISHQENSKQCENSNNNIKNNQQQQDLENNINKSLSMNSSMNGSKQCCSICLVEFVAQELVQKTICSHTFHIQCIKDWISKNENCPLCRQSFDIMDMIDYLTKEKLIQSETKEQKLTIIKNKNKIEDILLTQKEQIILFDDDDFLSIFKFFKGDHNEYLKKQPKQPINEQVNSNECHQISKVEKNTKLEDSNAFLNNQNYEQVTCLSPTQFSTITSPVSKFQSMYSQHQIISPKYAVLPASQLSPNMLCQQLCNQNQNDQIKQDQKLASENIPEEMMHPIQDNKYFSSKSQIMKLGLKQRVDLKNSKTYNDFKLKGDSSPHSQITNAGEEQKYEQNQDISENADNLSSFQNQTGNQKIFTSNNS